MIRCRLANCTKGNDVAVTVKFFASLREQMGRAEQQLDTETCNTVADVWSQVSGARTMPENLLSAVNLEYVPSSHPVKDGDEVAFFPPVTGG